MNRTAQYEQLLERIQSLRDRAIDARTMLRAYDDYARLLKATPTMGAMADAARDDLIEIARERVESCRRQIGNMEAEADRIEREGLGS